MYKVRLKEKYKTEIIPKMREKFGYRNNLAVPKVKKVVVNVGIGKIVKESKEIIERISKDIANITGQKPVVTKARKSISGFKTRKGFPIGIMVTLRKDKMYEFMDRLINAALPQIKDFQGLSKKSFDRNGNYNIGIKEYIVFPESIKDDIRNIIGIEINIITSAKTDKEACEFLKLFGFPIIDDM